MNCVRYSEFMLSVLIPVFNEEDAIEETIRRTHAVLERAGDAFEICVIDDGSTDRTGEILKNLNLGSIRIFTNQKNHGYSSSIKKGIRHSKGEIIGITDGDGTYPVEEFPRLMTSLKENQADMVVGARIRNGAQFAAMRKPAKWIVNVLASILTGIKIPDPNSGMRVFTRDLVQQFMHLYPQRFSFTITITLAALSNDYIVIYEPIDYFRRKGKSTLSSGMNGIRN